VTLIASASAPPQEAQAVAAATAKERAMHLFGDKSGPHLAHFHARRLTDQVELRWEVRNAGEVRWRVLRSESEYAERADALVGGMQSVVMEGVDTDLVDRVEEGKTYYYTVFVRDEQGAWHRQVKVKLKGQEDLRWRHGPDTLSNELAQSGALQIQAGPPGPH
jgi:hypothetical protein